MEPTPPDKQQEEPWQSPHNHLGSQAPAAAAQLSAAALAPKIGELLLACWIAIDVVSEIGRALRAMPQEAKHIIRTGEYTGSTASSGR
jgi:hypothetical protein